MSWSTYDDKWKIFYFWIWHIWWNKIKAFIVIINLFTLSKQDKNYSQRNNLFSTIHIFKLIFNHIHMDNTSIIQLWQIEGELINLSTIIRLKLHQKVCVSWGNEVNSNTFSSETTWSTNSVNVLRRIVGHIIVNNQINLLNINTSA